MNGTALSPPVALRPDFTFSKAELARRCAYWLRPEVPWTVEDANDCSTDGVTLHHAISSFVTCGNGINFVPPIEAELRVLYVRAKTWLIERQVVGMRAEIPFAYDTETGLARELVDPQGETGTRWYTSPEKREAYDGPGGPLRATEACTRVDLVCFGVDELGPFIRLWDWKFHFGFESVDAQAQLAFCSLAVARAYGIERVQAAAVHVWADRLEVEPAIALDDDGDIKVGPNDVPELDADALLDVADEIDDITRGPTNDPQPTAGAHCEERRCPASAACPLAKSAVTSALETIPADRLAKGASFYAPLETGDDGARALIEIDWLEAAIAERKKAVKALADRLEGFSLSNGKVYAGKPQPTETPNLEVEGAVEVLEQHGADFAMRVSTSWSALEEMGGEAFANEVREDLRAIGALKISTPVIYMARAPKVAKVAKTKKPRATSAKRSA